MPSLSFRVEELQASPAAASPELILGLRVENRPETERIENLLLNVQVRLEVRRRHYSEREQRELVELFGAPGRWGETLQSLLWTRTTLVVPGFSGSCRADVPLGCSFDLNVAAVRYFHGLDGGEVPFVVQLSGSVFHSGPEGQLQVAPVPWSCEAPGQLPVALWRQLMEQHYPGSLPLVLHREVVDRMRRFRMERGLTSWEETLETLLDVAVAGPGARA